MFQTVVIFHRASHGGVKYSLTTPTFSVCPSSDSLTTKYSLSRSSTPPVPLAQLRGASFRRSVSFSPGVLDPIAPSEFGRIHLCIAGDNPVAHGVVHSLQHRTHECFIPLDREDVYTFLVFYPHLGHSTFTAIEAFHFPTTQTK